MANKKPVKKKAAKKLPKSVMSKDVYVNVAMQMVPKSKASNTASSTKA